MKRHADFCPSPAPAACGVAPRNTNASGERGSSPSTAPATRMTASRLRTMTAASLPQNPAARAAVDGLDLADRAGGDHATSCGAAGRPRRSPLAADALSGRRLRAGGRPATRRCDRHRHRVGVFTITDESGRVIDSMPIDWSIYGMTRHPGAAAHGGRDRSARECAHGEPAPPR